MKRLLWEYDRMADNGVWKAATPFGDYELWETGDGRFWWEFHNFGRHSEATRELAEHAAQVDFDGRCERLMQSDD